MSYVFRTFRRVNNTDTCLYSNIMVEASLVIKTVNENTKMRRTKRLSNQALTSPIITLEARFSNITTLGQNSENQ